MHSDLSPVRENEADPRPGAQSLRDLLPFLSGNVFWLLGAVYTALRKRRRITEYHDMRDRVLSSGSYPEALAIMKEYVTLVDDDAG